MSKCNNINCNIRGICYNYLKIKDKPKKYGIVGLAWSLFLKDLQILRIVNKEKPDQLVGSDGSLARVGFIKRIPSFEYSEDMRYS